VAIHGHPNGQANGSRIADPAVLVLQRADDRFLRLKRELHEQVITAMDMSTIGKMTEDELRAEVRRAAEELTRLSTNLILQRTM